MRLALTAVLFLSTPVAAQPVVPKFSYKYPTSDGRFELVMLGSGDLPAKAHPSVKADDAALRAKYKHSGLYPAGNTTDPVWTTDEYWDYPASAFPDGVHAVRTHGGHSVVLRAIQQEGYPTDGRLSADAERAALDAPAVTFYARGKPLRTYTVRDLVSDPDAVPHGSERVLWCETWALHPESMRCSVETTDGNAIVIDVTTGEIIGRMKTHRWLTRQAWIARAVLAGVVIVVVAGFVGWRVRRRGVAVTAAVFLLATTTGESIADSRAPPFSYTVGTSNGKYRFAMIAPEESSRWNSERQKELLAIRDRYPKSGLYRNDGSRTPIWTVDWYAYRVFPTADGVHLVRSDGAGVVSGGIDRSGPNRAEIRRFFEQTAFSFYANGQLVGECGTRDLVDDVSGMECSVTSIHWLESAELDDTTMQFIVHTKDGNRIVLDVRTGRVTEKQTNPVTLLKRWGLRLLPVLLLFTIGAIIWRGTRRRATPVNV